MIKYRIRQVSIKYSKQKPRERRACLATTEQKVKQCFSCIAVSVLLTCLAQCLPNFYRGCFEVWCNLCVKPILSREQALSQLLWNNQSLRIGGKSIFNKTLFSKGLISLANILTNTGSLKPYTFFKAEGLNINDYLLLFGLFNSLPPTWKMLINSKDYTSADTSADSRNTKLS